MGYFCQEFVLAMQGEFEMAMMGIELFSRTVDQADENWNLLEPNKVLQRCDEKV